MIINKSKVHTKNGWYPKYAKLYHPITKTLLEKGLQVSYSRHLQMLEKQKELQSNIKNVMQKNNIDFWISPAAMSYPPKLTDGTTGNPAMNIPWTFAGLPSISLPIKQLGKLPLGLQIVGEYMQDERLLAVSKNIERTISE